MRSTILAAIAAFAFSNSAATHAAVLNWDFTLAPEAPGATGTGSATASFDDATNIFSYDVTFSGLSGITTVSHFHCCTASPGTGTIGVAVAPGTLLNTPVGVTSGTFSGFYDLDSTASFTGTFLNNFGAGTAAGATAAFIAGLNAGSAYLNIHTSAFPGGEIRAFAQRVPEPGTLALLGFGIAGLALVRRRK